MPCPAASGSGYTDWIEKNHVGLKPPKLPDHPRKMKVFTPEQLK
jgi:hypothetical protein